MNAPEDNFCLIPANLRDGDGDRRSDLDSWTFLREYFADHAVVVREPMDRRGRRDRRAAREDRPAS